MASTYVNDLRLNEMATGDQSGSWGTVTNTNLELIAEAFSYGTEAITTNADTHTTTIADGATDPGRSMFLKYTGTLDSACTITICPNTVSKLWFIENATSGSQNIIIKQGSGATVTIASGKTKVIYSDGVGSGAKMVDAFAALDVGSMSVDNITIDGTTIALSSGNLTLDVAGNINLDADGGSITLKDGGTSFGTLFKSSNNLIIYSTISDGDIKFQGNDGGSDITALTLDMSEAGAATFNSTIAAGAATFTTADNTDTLVVYSSDADANVGPIIRLWRNSGSPADNDGLGAIIFSGEDDVDAKTDYASIESFALDVTNGTEDGELTIYTVLAGAKVNRLDFNSTETIFNSPGANLDFRVESDANTHMLFVDGGNNRVGIGASTPEVPLHIFDNSATSHILVQGDTNDASIKFNKSGQSFVVGIDATDDSFRIADSGSLGTNDKLIIDASGNVGIGAVPSGSLTAGYNLRLDGGAQTYLAFNNDTHTTQVLGGFVIGNDSGAARITQRENQPIIFATNNTDRWRINNSGRQSYNGNATAVAHGNFVGEVASSGFRALSFEHTVGGGEVGSIRTTSSNAVYYGDGSNLTGVGGSTALGAVGTYALIKNSNSTYSAGDTVAFNSFFRYSTANGSVGGAQPSGTWRAMGYAGYNQVSVWVRIS